MALVKLLKRGGNNIPRDHNAGADEISFLSVQGGNVKLAGNSITSEDVDGNIILDPNGTGVVNINNAYDLPAADGTANQILQTNGSGVVSFADPGSAQKVCKAYTADEALATNDVVYISAADNVSKADASAEATSRVVGLVEVGVADTDPVTVCSEGIMAGFTGLTPGARYFLDTVTAGLITTAPALDDEQGIVQIGYAKSATELDLQIEVIQEVDDD